MSAEQTKSLMENRAELEKQLQRLTDRRDALYTPGMTMISGEPRPIDEQRALQIEERAPESGRQSPQAGS
jgi:hypothetical protein